MKTGRVVPNAGSHRILEALLKGPKTTRDLRILIGAVNGNGRFEGEYLERMRRNGYAKLSGDKWQITEGGKSILQKLGPSKRASQLVAQSRTPSAFVAFESPLTGPPPIRSGSMDFKNFPSRVGDRLHYKTGVVLKKGDDDGN